MRDVVDKAAVVVFFPREFQFPRLGNIPPILYSPPSLHLLFNTRSAGSLETLQTKRDALGN
jgi:hypothetical protein